MADSQPQAGDQVRFLGCNGYPAQLEDAKKHFEVGQVLTLRAVNMFNWHTDYYFEEGPQHAFNSVMFGPVEVVEPAPPVEVPLLTFGYTNYRGEQAVRQAMPTAVVFQQSPWHGPDPQWLLLAKDQRSGQSRDFCLKDVTTPKDLELRQTVQAFVKKHEITCPETIAQVDSVIVDAYDFIQQLVEIVGYHQRPDEEPASD